MELSLKGLPDHLYMKFNFWDFKKEPPPIPSSPLWPREDPWWSLLREQTWDSNKSSNTEFCCPPITRETKRETREASSGFRITARGYLGWPAYQDRDRTRAIERWGIPQDVDAEPSIESRKPLNSNITLSISRSTLSLWDPLFQIKPSSARISFFLFLSVQRSIVWIFPFLFTNLII
jgi:hypothetical protein